jgi:ElaB/YqjD/DUF883 family membrane-anchored ribosome-binding protein
MAKHGIGEEKLEEAESRLRGTARAALSDGGEENGDASGFELAERGLRGLRAAVDHAANSLRGLSRTGEEWAKDAQDRTVAIGKGLRSQGERAVDGVSRQVEQNPLASLAVAFALGFLCAAAITRRSS